MGNEIEPLRNKSLDYDIINNDSILSELYSKLDNKIDIEKTITQIGLRLVELTDNGKVSRESAMSCLCGFIFNDTVRNNELLDGAVGIACDLELPNKQVYGDISNKWIELKELLKKLKQ